MLNFIPDPNSTAPTWQQYLDYENAKFFTNTGVQILFFTLALFAGVMLILEIYAYFKRKKEGLKPERVKDDPNKEANEGHDPESRQAHFKPVHLDTGL